MYESAPEEYCTKEHKWFKHAEAEEKRKTTRSFLLSRMLHK